MSITSRIGALEKSLRSSRKAVLGRGGEISLAAGYKDLPEAIYKIPADASLAYRSDDSVAYRKVVPSGAEEYAQVAKVGGMTYKCKNLTNAGTVQVNESAYVNISLSAGTTYYLSTYITSDDTDNTNENVMALRFEDDTYYFVGVPRGKRTPVSFTPSKNVNRLTLFAGQNFPTSAGDTATWADIMITTENTDVYEPYFEGLRDTKVTELVSEGANLLPRAWIDTQTINGVTFTVQEDNSVIVNGTATKDTAFSILRGKQANEFITLEQGETYTLSGCPKGGSASTYVMIVQDTGYRQNYDDFGDGVTAVANYTDYYAYIRILAGYTANNLVFKPMFVRGTTAKPYSPFGTIVDTFPISAELRAFLEPYGYGQGNPDNHNEYNYIDFEKKVFSYFGNVVDGVWVACENPTEIDISAYLPNDNFIAVQGGGTIKAVNEHKQDAPSTINYIEKVG